MRFNCLTDTSVKTAGSVLGAAMALAVLGTATAHADSLVPSDTVTYSSITSAPSVSGSGAATSITPTVSYSLGNAFNSTPLTDFPGSIAAGSGTWNFYDDYVFTVTGSNIQGAVVSFLNSASAPPVGIGDLQARIFSTTTPYDASVAASNLGNPPSTGSVVEDVWASPSSTGLYVVNLTNTQLAPGTYDLQIRGEVASGGGSYGGSVSFTPVPLPGGLMLLVSGLGLFGAAATRRVARRG